VGSGDHVAIGDQVDEEMVSSPASVDYNGVKFFFEELGLL
jgi:hypothetical protein